MLKHSDIILSGNEHSSSFRPSSVTAGVSALAAVPL